MTSYYENKKLEFTGCCGATLKGSNAGGDEFGVIVCRACYQEVDEMSGYFGAGEEGAFMRTLRSDQVIKKFIELIKGLSKPYRVEVNELHDTGQEWVPCVREDIVTEDGDMSIIETEATFCTPKDAETFITAMCDLIHMGGKREWFRIVKEEG